MSAATLASPVKFDFGETFDDLVDGDDGGKEKERTWTEEEVEGERAAALQRGMEQGRAQALAGIEQKIAEANTTILTHIARINTELETTATAMKTDARALALVVGRKLGSELLAQARERDIEALVSEALALLPGQPHVVIRVNETILDGVRSRFETIADQVGYQGKLILLGEPDIDRADCRIEWADGGMLRDTGGLATEIDRIVQAHMQAAPGPTDTDTPTFAETLALNEPDEERT